jgi:hypothetical protein
MDIASQAEQGPVPLAAPLRKARSALGPPSPHAHAEAIARIALRERAPEPPVQPRVSGQTDGRRRRARS